MFDGSAYLDLSERLARQVGDEAAERSASSRAYYAAFHAARDHLDRRSPKVPRDGSAHAVVRDRIAAQSPAVGQNPRRLHGWRRNAADDDECPFATTSQATTAVALARRLMREIGRLA